jgi:hypothetical protein
MKYTFISMCPVDEFDSVIKVQAVPNALEEMLGRKKRILRYYGSGTTWREGQDGPRCDMFTSEWLHGLWNRELKRTTDAKNCAAS